MTLYAKLEDGRVDQESARKITQYQRESPVFKMPEGYVPALAVRAEGVAEIRKWLRNRRGKSGSGLLCDVLRALGLEQEEP